MKRNRPRGTSESPLPEPGETGGSTDPLAPVVTLYREGRISEAITACRTVIGVHPDRAEAVHLLGLLLIKSGSACEAAEALRAAVRLNPGYAAAWNDLGNLCCEQGQSEQAVGAYRRAVELRTDFTDAWLNLGNALKQLKRFDDSAAAFRRVLKLDPARSTAHRELCAVLRSGGRVEETRQALQSWLEHEPGQPVATHLLAALGGGQIPERASDRYVEHVFDQFASTFERQLEQLQYQAPGLIATTLAELVGLPGGSLNVLDAGCGTGLCGPILRPYARQLTGVDLSPQMLEVARGKGLFDLLETVELSEYMQQHPQTWDLIVACDTFNYFGQLEPLLAVAGRALRPQGLLVFTLEHDSDEARGTGFRLTATGRYCHSLASVRSALAQANIDVRLLRDVTLRIEAGQPVPGMLIAAG